MLNPVKLKIGLFTDAKSLTPLHIPLHCALSSLMSLLSLTHGLNENQSVLE